MVTLKLLQSLGNSDRARHCVDSGFWESERSPEEAQRIPGRSNHSFTEVNIYFARRNLTMAVTGHLCRFSGIRFASSGLRAL